MINLTFIMKSSGLLKHVALSSSLLSIKSQCNKQTCKECLKVATEALNTFENKWGDKLWRNGRHFHKDFHAWLVFAIREIPHLLVIRKNASLQHLRIAHTFSDSTNEYPHFLFPAQTFCGSVVA